MSVNRLGGQLKALKLFGRHYALIAQGYIVLERKPLKVNWSKAFRAKTSSKFCLRDSKL